MNRKFHLHVAADYKQANLSSTRGAGSWQCRTVGSGREEAPVGVACGTVITVKHILIECADLLEIRRKYFEERSLHVLFLNLIPEIIFDFFARG